MLALFAPAVFGAQCIVALTTCTSGFVRKELISRCGVVLAFWTQHEAKDTCAAAAEYVTFEFLLALIVGAEGAPINILVCEISRS